MRGELGNSKQTDRWAVLAFALDQTCLGSAELQVLRGVLTSGWRPPELVTQVVSSRGERRWRQLSGWVPWRRRWAFLELETARGRECAWRERWYCTV